MSDVEDRSEAAALIYNECISWRRQNRPSKDGPIVGEIVWYDLASADVDLTSAVKLLEGRIIHHRKEPSWIAFEDGFAR